MNEKMAGFMKSKNYETAGRKRIVISILSSILLIALVFLSIEAKRRLKQRFTNIEVQLEQVETRTANIESVITKLAIKHNDVVGYLKQQESKVNDKQESPKNESRLFNWFL